ncbi:hypothetical protein GQ44DRAFT_733404 [Phaeosphaeriaceae sp. PMI808]|nr:hypothetical protein GQ44DRAFT_733404 [Phaeosphaeriaceae sp. PMI808]
MEGQKDVVELCVEQLLAPTNSLDHIEIEDWPLYNAYDSEVSLKPLPRRIVVKGLPGSGKTSLIGNFVKEKATEFFAVFRPWLLVLDSWKLGVDETAHVVLGQNSTMLVSTISQPDHQASLSVRMGYLDVQEAITLLLRRVSRWKSRADEVELRESIRTIVKDDLGCYPLAIVQAGGLFEKQKELEPAEFRACFANTPESLEEFLKIDHKKNRLRACRLCLENLSTVLRSYQSSDYQRR